jgi:tight adherence protein C
MSILIALGFGAAVTMFVIGIALSRSADPLQSRLNQFGTREVRTLEEIELEASFSERVIKPIIQQMSKVVMRFTGQKGVDQTQLRLEMAGNPNNWTSSDFMGVRGLAALVCGGLLFAVMFLAQAAPLQLLLFSVGGAVIGFVMPNFWLGSKIKARQDEIQKALPDALDLLTISVEAGLGLDQGMAKVSEKFENELGRAFGRVISETRVGKPKNQALRDMAARANVSDLNSFVTALIQAEQLGVSLSKVLRIQSEQMRIKRRQRAEEQAHKAPTKMSVVLVLFLLPSLCMVMMGPVIPRLCRQFWPGNEAFCGRPPGQ